MEGADTQTKSMGKTSSHDVYYSVGASSLNKRPMGEIVEEATKKKGLKKAGPKPNTKKTFTNVVSRIDTGVKKSLIAAATSVRVSDGVTAKNKDELFGRVSTEQLAKFLMQQYNQA